MADSTWDDGTAQILHARDISMFGSMIKVFYHQQQHSPLFFLLFNTAIAQPTPLLTEIASKGQFFRHAPHSIHESRSIITAFLAAIPMTS